ncbi:hypothetical protein D3C73_757630 [compost metagenome]
MFGRHGRAQIAGGRLEQAQPVVEVARIDGQGQVFGHGSPLIDAGGQDDGRPEQLHLLQMRTPVVDAGVEDRADEIVFAHLGVEALDQGVDHVFVDAGFGADAGHGGFPTCGGFGSIRRRTVDTEGDRTIRRAHDV